ncbi:MAG: radical SAM protein [Candidatus Micrarchaeota archaeon]|nr:radical SAM protein [Candidatus Micrarchaeota archaeon]
MRIIPDVSIQFTDKFPEGYTMSTDGWRFTEEEIRERLPDGTRKLLTLDITIPPEKYTKIVNKGKREELTERANRFYGMVCPNNCPGCFEKSHVENPLLTWDEINDIIEQALPLGLKTVRFLGPGEFFSNPDMFKILDYFRDKGITFGIFTKGAELGDDELSLRIHGITSEELCKRVALYENVNILIDYRTTDREKANATTASQSKDYIMARTRAIERFVRLGLNKWPNQRLTLQTNPVLLDNIDEVFEMFKWGTVRNLPVRICPTMISGKGENLIKISQMKIYQKKLKEVAVNVYSYLIENGIMTFEQVRKEGISSYIGTTPCSTANTGMFIKKDGQVFLCTGRDTNDMLVASDVRKEPLKDIWKKSPGYRLGPTFNNRCVAKDGISIPSDFYDYVMNKLEERFS